MNEISGECALHLFPLFCGGGSSEHRVAGSENESQKSRSIPERFHKRPQHAELSPIFGYLEENAATTIINTATGTGVQIGVDNSLVASDIP